jgi:hypothetical protein
MKPSLLSALCTASLVSLGRAQGLLPTHRISPDLANQAVAAVVAKCASQGYAETGVLVDADGVQQAVLRGNRAGAHTLDSAFAKATRPRRSRPTRPRSLKGPRRYRCWRTYSNCHICFCWAGASSSSWATRWSERSAPPGAPGGDLDVRLTSLDNAKSSPVRLDHLVLLRQ